MRTFAQFRSKIKSARTAEDIRNIYAEAMTIIDNDNLYNKVIKECVRREQQLGA